jgi:hypothetical protein
MLILSMVIIIITDMLFGRQAKRNVRLFLSTVGIHRVHREVTSTKGATSAGDGLGRDAQSRRDDEKRDEPADILFGHREEPLLDHLDQIGDQFDGALRRGRHHRRPIRRGSFPVTNSVTLKPPRKYNA